MNLSELEAFVAVVDYGSVVAAAAHLHLTQSAVSRRIQNLEHALGVPLLDRKIRPAQPTRAGKETYEFAKPVLGSVNDLKSAITNNGEAHGEFRFGVSRGLGDTALTRPIKLLRAEYPQLKIQALAQWSDSLLGKLLSHSLDAAVVVLPEGSAPPGPLVGEHLGTETFDVVAAKAIEFPKPVTLEKLSSYSWILNPHGCAGARAIKAAMLHHRLPLVVAIEAEGYDLQLSLVAQSVGLGLVMSRVLQTSPFRKQIKTVKPKDFSFQQAVWVLHSQHIGRLGRAVECLGGLLSRNCLWATTRHK